VWASTAATPRSLRWHARWATSDGEVAGVLCGRGHDEKFAAEPLLADGRLWIDRALDGERESKLEHTISLT
jgi:hypothetical protein